MTTTATLRLVGLLLIVGVGTGCGGSAESTTNVVAGLVETEAGEPLEDALVYVHRADSSVSLARTGPEGHFSVEVERGELVRIQASKPRRATAANGEVVWQALGADLGDVRAGMKNLKLVAGVVPLDRVLRIRVLSPDGPVPGARVGMTPRPVPMHWYNPDPTDESGLTVQARLTSNPVTVRVFRKAPWCGAYAPYLLPEAAATAGVHEIHLVRDRTVEGTLVDESGQPVAGMSVMPVSRHPGTSLAWGDLSGLDGRFRVGVPDTWESATLVVGRQRPHSTSRGHSVAELALQGQGAKDDVVVPVPPAALAVPAVEVDPRHEPEAHRVIAAVLKHRLADGKDQVVLIARPWRVDSFASDPERSSRLSARVHESTLRDFHRKNETIISPPVTLELDVPVLVVEHSWLNHIHSVQRPRGWDHLDQRFPGSGGVVELSAVGFSDRMDEAILHLGRRRGGLAGAGHYYLLALKGEEWVVVHRETTWIS